MLPARNGYNHDTLNCMHQLVARGKDEVARLVLNQLSGEYENSNLLLSGSRSLFRDMVMKNRVRSFFLYIQRVDYDPTKFSGQQTLIQPY